MVDVQSLTPPTTVLKSTTPIERIKKQKAHVVVTLHKPYIFVDYRALALAKAFLVDIDSVKETIARKQV